MQTLPMRLNVEPEAYRKMLGHFENDLRVSCPGVIESFNPDTQTATVKLAIKEKINLNNFIPFAM